MPRAPAVIICPKCGGVSAQRRRRSCRFCGVLLVYSGEYWLPDQSGYYWDGRRWVALDEMVRLAQRRIAAGR